MKNGIKPKSFTWNARKFPHRNRTLPV